MWGQWIGTISGTNTGVITLNIDNRTPKSGVIMIADDVPELSANAKISLQNNSGEIFGTMYDFFTSGMYRPEITEKKLMDVALPHTGEIKGTLKGDIFSGTWKSDLGSNGDFILAHYEQPTLLPPTHPEINTWEDFKKWALQMKHSCEETIFRGHANANLSLVSTFHRKKRLDLTRFHNEDITNLATTIEDYTGEVFDLNTTDGYSALLNLARHHGFPAPLLD